MGHLLIILLAGAFSAQAQVLPVFDPDFECITAAQGQQFVNDFNIDTGSFGGLELCNSAVDTKKLFNDLRLIGEGQFTSTPPNPFIRDFIPATEYYSWLRRETRGIERGNDMPTATAYNSGGYFTMQDGWAKLSTAGRVGVTLHEGRHTAGFYHRPCSHGPYFEAESDACDESMNEGGAHGVEMEYLARVAVRGTNFHPVYQSMARLMLLARSNFVFNQNPLSGYDTLLALTEQGLIRIKDGKRVNLNRAPGLPIYASLKRTSFGATVFLPPDAWAVDLFDAQPQSAVQDDYSYFKLLKATPPADLLDIEEFDSGSQRYLFAGHNSQISSYVFGEGSWSSPVSAAAFSAFKTVAPDGREGIFARFEGGTYCALDLRRQVCIGGRQLWPAETKTFVKYKGHTLSLGQDGLVRAEDGSFLAELSGLNVIDLVSVPVYEVF